MEARRPWWTGIVPLSILGAALLIAGCDGDGDDDDDDSSGTPVDCDEGYIDDNGTCVPEACGTGTWGDLAVDTNTVYVLQSAGSGGDGGEDSPFGTIAEGIGAVEAGGMVAVGAGVYQENLEIAGALDGVTLAGRCPDLVTLDASEGEDVAGILVDVDEGAALAIAGLTITEAPKGGIDVQRGELELNALVLLDNVGAGIVVGEYGFDATATITDVDIQATQALANGQYGFGLLVQYGTQVEARDCTIDAATSAGVEVINGSSMLSLIECTISGTRISDGIGGGTGLGVIVGDGATVVLERSLITSIPGGGLAVLDPGSTASLSDTTIENIGPDAFGDASGILIEDGASVEMIGGEVREIGDENAHGEGTSICVGASFSSEVTLHDVSLSSCGLMGVFAEESSDMTLDNVTISQLDPNSSLGLATGIAVANSTAMVQGGTITEAVGFAAYCGGSGATLELNGTKISQTTQSTVEGIAVGVTAYDHCVINMNDVEIDDTAGTGLALEGGAEVNATGVTISSTTLGAWSSVAPGVSVLESILDATEMDISGTAGPGIWVVTGGEATCTGCTIINAEVAGIAVDQGATLRFESGTISGVGQGTNIDGGVGVYARGVDGFEPTVLEVIDSDISGAPMSSVWLSGENGSYTVTGSTISGGEGIPRGSDTKCGDALYATSGVKSWDGLTGLMLDTSELEGATRAGLFLDGSSASLASVELSNNGTDLVRQGDDCHDLPTEWDGSDTAELCPTYTYLVCDVEIRGDVTVSEALP